MLRDCIDAALADGLRELILDLSGVTFIDSSGLAAVVEASRRAARSGVEFGVAPGDGRVRQVLAITQIDRRLRIV